MENNLDNKITEATTPMKSFDEIKDAALESHPDLQKSPEKTALLAEELTGGMTEAIENVISDAKEKACCAEGKCGTDQCENGCSDVVDADDIVASEIREAPEEQASSPDLVEIDTDELAKEFTKVEDGKAEEINAEIPTEVDHATAPDEVDMDTRLAAAEAQGTADAECQEHTSKPGFFSKLMRFFKK